IGGAEHYRCRYGSGDGGGRGTCTRTRKAQRFLRASCLLDSSSPPRITLRNTAVRKRVIARRPRFELGLPVLETGVLPLDHRRKHTPEGAAGQNPMRARAPRASRWNRTTVPAL